MNSGDVAASAFGDMSSSKLLTGRYLGLSDRGLARVQVTDELGQTAEILAQSNNLYEPIAGDDMWLIWASGIALMLGPTKMREAEGVITGIGVDGGNAVYDVRTDTGVSYPKRRAFMPALRVMDGSAELTVVQQYQVGDRVSLNWNLNGVIEGSWAKPAATPTAAGPTPTAGAAEFRATWVDDWYTGGAGAWSNPAPNQVWTSDNNAASAGYGGQIAATIPDGAVGTSAAIKLPKVGQFASQPPLWGFHSSPTRPGGNVAVTTIGRLPGTDGWVELDAAQAAALVGHLRTTPGGIGMIAGSGGGQKWSNLIGDDTAFSIRLGWSV